MGRHNGAWVPAHEGALEHEKTLKAAKVLIAKLGVAPECAPAIVFTATLRIELHALRQGETGIVGFMPDGQLGTIGFPEKCYASKGRRRYHPEEVGRVLRAALHAGGQLVGEGREERVHDFRDHCRHIVSDRERKRIRVQGKPGGALPRTDEPDHVADAAGGSRGIPSKAPAEAAPRTLPGPSPEPPRKFPGGSAETGTNGKTNGKAPEGARTDLGHEIHRVCGGRRDVCEVAAAEALHAVPRAWALAWAQGRKPGDHPTCFDLRRALEQAYREEHPADKLAVPKSGGAVVRLEDDPGWSPGKWPVRGETAPDYAARTGLSAREAAAGLVVAKRRGEWARVPAPQ